MQDWKTFAKWFGYALILGFVNAVIITVFDLPIQRLAPEWAWLLFAVEILFFALIIERFQGHDAVFEALELMPDIVRVAEGNTSLRAQVETKLQELDRKGIHLTSAVKSLWAGERNPATLTTGLSKADAALMRQVLLLLGEPQPQGI